MKKILLLGSTGSIGASACNCIRRYPDLFSVVGLAANTNGEKLIAQIREFKPLFVCVTNPQTAAEVQKHLPASTTFLTGDNALCEMVHKTDFDILLNALVGAVGFRPTVAALKRNKRVALANKESLVIGGEYISTLLSNGCGELVPIDSEHSALLQCISGEDRAAIETLVLTASGGPFRELASEHFPTITPQQALNHPTWSMGPKITIDSATLINKGFEVIEAHYLFCMPYDRISVLIHPQSIVHSMVQMHDGAVMAQLGLPDMELPIQYALSYPSRMPLPAARLQLSEIEKLTFFKPDYTRFPCLKLCIDAGVQGQTMPVVLNAANEVAVKLFLENTIAFTEIPAIIERMLATHTTCVPDCEEVIEEVDRATRQKVLLHYSIKH